MPENMLVPDFPSMLTSTVSWRSMTSLSVDLSRFSSREFSRGRPLFIEAIWKIVSTFFFECHFLHAYRLKRVVLRLFGSKVGKGVLIKPRVKITFPWRLTFGDYCWIGEGVWIDNLSNVDIGPHACISQRAYLCTGNHDLHKTTFDLSSSPIRIEAGAWITAGSIVGPGVTVGEHAMLALGSVASQTLESNGIYRGNPAQKIGIRSFTG